MPSVNNISGCVDSGNSTTNCATAGGTVITINGNALGSPATSFVRLNGALCTNLQGNSNQLTCKLPAGTGAPAKLVIQDGTRASPVINLVSYIAATVTMLTSPNCTQNGNSLINCPRDNSVGETQITLIGVNFGPLTPSIIIGGSVCTNPVSGPNPDTSVSCNLPSGTNTGVSVIFIQGGGQITLTPLTVDFLQCQPGHFAPPSVLACTACPPATFSSSIGAFFCAACPSGTFSSQPATIGCTQCSRGSYSTVSPLATLGNTNCTLCQPGSYADYLGMAECTYCLPGSYTNSSGAQSCAFCDMGRYTGGIGSSACIDCGQGTYFPSMGGTQCTPCSPGTAMNLTGQAACASCSPGTIAALGGMFACTNCGPGQFQLSPGQAACQECDAGFYNSMEGAAACESCEPGSYSVKVNGLGPLFCSLCAVGSYNPESGQGACLACLPGTFTNSTNSTGCEKCPPGRSTNQPSSVSCFDCQPGYYADQPGTILCLQCPVGTATGSSASQSCPPCQQGYYQDQAAQNACKQCSPGTAMPVVGQALCLACDSGTYANDTGFVVCTQCDVGRYSQKLGAVGPVECTDCAAGTFGALPGLPSCVNCPVGSYQNATEQLSCLPCPVGTAAQTTGSVSCAACQPGNFATNIGAIVCDQCAVGQFSNISQATICSNCPPGNYQPGSGKSFCLECSAGSYSGFSGQQACVLCVPGTFTNVPGVSACEACGFGTYADISGMQNCKNCDAGKYQPSLAQAYCIPCNVGYYQDQTGQQACIQCEVGRVQSQTQSVSCDNCTAGSYSSALGSITCTLCNPGTYLNADGGSGCTQCDRGTAQPEPGQQVCASCLPGQYQPATGQYACTKCDPGTFSALAGLTVCEPCARGTYSISGAGNIGPTTCKQCSAGYHQQAQAQSECTLCELGTSGNVSGMFTCTPCDPGLYTDQQGQTTCVQCPSGRVTAVSGQFYCVPCDLGYFNNETGQSVCEQCPAGSIASSPGSLVCTDCLPGTFQSAPAQKACVACDVGSYAGVPGSSGCSQCGVGTAQPLSSSVSCGPCAPGSAQPARGQAKCIGCLPGSYDNETGSANCTQCEAGRAQDQGSSVLCSICPPGSFAAPGATECKPCPAGQVAVDAGTETCTACPPDSTPDTTRVLCLCEVGFALVESDTSDLYCVGCPQGAVCTERGLIWGQLVSEPGWYVRNEQFEQCLLRTNCPGGGTGGDAQCAPHRVGVLCAVCAVGYTQDFSGNCVPCGTRSKSYGFLFLVLFIFLGILVVLYGFILNSGRQLIYAAKIESHIAAGTSQGYIADEHYEVLDHNFRHGRIVTIEGAPAPKPNATFKLKIALGFLQICTNLMFSMDIPWPWGFKSFLLVFNFANLDFFANASVDCVVDQDVYYYIKLWGSALIPIGAVVCLYLFYVVPNYFLHRLKTREDFAHRKATRQRFWCLVMFTLFLVYPYVCAVILRLYQCISPYGETRLRHDMTVMCDPNSLWGVHTKLAAPMAILYPAGIPLLMFLMLRRYQKVGRLNELGVRAELGFLYDAYERRFWWWEMVDMIHKLTVVAMVAFLPNAYYQVPGALLVVYFYFAAILWCKPYLRKADDRVHQAAQSELVLFLLAATYLLYDVNPTPAEEWWFTFILIFAFCIFFLFFFSGLLYSLKKLFESSKIGQDLFTRFDDWLAQQRGLQRYAKQNKRRISMDERKPLYTFMDGIQDLEYDVREKYKASQSMRYGLDDDDAYKVKMTRSPLRAEDINTGAVSYEAHTGQEIVAVVNPLSKLVGDKVGFEDTDPSSKHGKDEFDVVPATIVVQPAQAEPARVEEEEMDGPKKVKVAM